MSLFSLRNITVSFGGPPVLSDVGLTIASRERICLVGRNGEGKSTLLRLIAGEIEPDSGEIEQKPSLRVAKLDQEVPRSLPGTVFDIVAQGAGESAQLLAEYHRVSLQVGENPQDTGLFDRLETLQNELERTDGWAYEHRVERLLTRLELDADAEFDSLSGGAKRRTLLARALAGEPEILLLDEPTNHLDLPSIRWLEGFLGSLGATFLFVSHDRAFVRRLATRVLDLDRGRLTSWECDYDTYVTRKEEWIEAEAKQDAVFDKKLAREETWIRQGIKARRTRNEGRVAALEKMREERARRRQVQGVTNMQLHDARQSGRKVITAENVTFTYGDAPLIQDFSTTIWRSDRIGIVGANGSGKTTLLHLLLGRLSPAGGTVTHGTRLQVAYFDQHREQLDEERSVAQNVSPDSDTVTIDGKPKHILSYLKDFLFSPETARAPIRRLSGGERARLLLARLFLRPANVLVLDEPTNDLDFETMELLEDLLLRFQGTVLIVSHDRAFLDNVVTSTFVLEGDGRVQEYVGGTENWLRLLERREAAEAAASREKKSRPHPPVKKAKLSYREREEYAALPMRIEALESEHAQLADLMGRPEFYQQPGSAQAEATERVRLLADEIETAYQRWSELEEKAGP